MNAPFCSFDKHSVCVFVEKLSDGSNHALGSGCFFMKRDIVLTAKHVLEEAVENKKPVFIANGSENGKLFGARPLRFYPHPEIDLALVQVSTEGLKIDHPFYPSHFALNETTGTVAAGYDRNASDNVNNSWVVGLHRIESFEIERREHRLGSKEYTLHFEAPWIEPGCSGGPVITAGGGVAAVLIQGFANVKDSAETSPKNFGRATSIYPMVDAFHSPFE